MLARPSTFPETTHVSAVKHIFNFRQQFFWKYRHDAGLQIQKYTLGPLYM